MIEPMFKNPFRKRVRRRSKRNPGELAVFGGNPRRPMMSSRRRRGGARDRSGRFLPRGSRNPRRRIRRRVRRHNPARRVYRRRHSYRRSFIRRHRRNPAMRLPIPGVSNVTTIVGIAVGAIAVRAITPQVMRFIPVPALQVGWGAVLSTVLVGGALSWGVGKFAGRQWGTAVMSGTIALAAVQASDLILPGLPSPTGLYVGNQGVGAVDVTGGDAGGVGMYTGA